MTSFPAALAIQMPFLSPVFSPIMVHQPTINPASLADMSLWIDPSDLSTVTVSGGLVSQINDKSPTGAVFTAAGTARPTHTRLTRKGEDRFSLAFDGDDDGMTGDSATDALMDGIDDGTVFIVAKSSHDNADADTVIRCNTGPSSDNYSMRVIHIDEESNSRYDRLRFVFRNSAESIVITERTSGSTKVAYPVDNYHIAMGRYTRVSGASGRTAGSDNNLNNGSDNLALLNEDDQPVTLGMDGAGGSHFTGEIVEILIYNRALTDAQIRDVERYLANKHEVYTPNCDWIYQYPALQQLRAAQGEMGPDSDLWEKRIIEVGTDYSDQQSAMYYAYAGDTVLLEDATTLTADVAPLFDGLNPQEPLIIAGTSMAATTIDGDGTYEVLGNGKNNILFRDFHVTNTAASGIIFGTGNGDGGSGIRATRIKTTNVGTNGIYSDEASFWLVDDCDLSGPGDSIHYHCMYIAGGQYGTVKDCTLHDSNQGFGCRGEGQNMLVFNNEFNDCDKGASVFTDDGFITTNYVIRDNIFDGTARTLTGDSGTNILFYGSSTELAEAPTNVAALRNTFANASSTYRHMKTTDGINGSVLIDVPGYENVIEAAALNADSIGEPQKYDGFSVLEALEEGKVVADTHWSYHEQANWILAYSAANQALIHAGKYDKLEFDAL